jgi:hypothetical protein
MNKSYPCKFSHLWQAPRQTLNYEARLEKLTSYKLSSLFWICDSDKEKKFHNFRTSSQFYKTFLYFVTDEDYKSVKAYSPGNQKV